MQNKNRVLWQSGSVAPFGIACGDSNAAEKYNYESHWRCQKLLQTTRRVGQVWAPCTTDCKMMKLSSTCLQCPLSQRSGLWVVTNPSDMNFQGPIFAGLKSILMPSWATCGSSAYGLWFLWCTQPTMDLPQSRVCEYRV